jgi:beta-glucanase (GH16 family)
MNTRRVLCTLSLALTAAAAQAAPPLGQTVWLRAAANNNFVSANTGALVANSTSAGAQQQFQVVDAGGGWVALRAVGNGRFVSADLNRGAWAPLWADRTAVADWERFQWVERGGNSIALRGLTTARYVAADLNRAAALVADRTAISTWETFTWGAAGPTPTPTPTPTPSPGTWRLVWSDEFNGTALDRSRWILETGGHGWGNNELEYYTDRTGAAANARVEGGNLVIEARREDFGGRLYTSARMKTSASWTYGRIEGRLRLPFGQGIWPAFWTLGNNIGTVGWPACGEIDIMEMIGGSGRESTVHGTIHWDFNGYANFGRSFSGPNFSQAFHVYAIEWDNREIRWYVDGTLYNTANITINGTEEFHRPFFIILNVAVGGNWPGNPDGSTTFPQRMLVDYIRVYQR